jgi:glycosyltransferase involved in cell wall biosynthesis
LTRASNVNPISVLIDASQLTGQTAHSGIGTYVRGLLGGMACHQDVAMRALVTDDALLPEAVDRVRIRRLTRQGRPAVWEHEARRSYELLRVRADLFHNPNPHAPAVRAGRWVQTLHDVIPLVFDDPVLATVRRRWRRFGPRYRKADRVIAISRHAADEGIRLLGLDARRVEIIHHGVASSFSPGPTGADDTATDAPYLSLVSEFSARKGFGEAFAVIAALSNLGYPHRLKVAGNVPPWVRLDFERLITAAERRDRVDVLGFVPDLPSLYRGASVHLVTSRYEGFGFPALEAMACGTPVVAFANSSLPEIVADGGILVDDGDVEAAIAAVRSILDSPALGAELREQALARASTFTWDECARRHAEVYRDVTRQ